MLISVYFSKLYHDYQVILQSKPLADVVLELTQNETYKKLYEISPSFINSIIAMEDRRFYERSGFDFRAFFRSIWVNLQTGELVQGGSTIPQQVGKLLYFDHLQTLDEKVIQVYIMYDLESQFSKDEILEMYVNSIYYGSGYTGIAEASQGYFGLAPINLEYTQSSLLAGIVAAPSVYDPRVNFDLSKQRQYAVLLSLVETGIITQEQMDQIFNEPIIIQ